jgi:hypothetical protein
VPFLPADVLWSIADYPIVPRWDGDGIEGYGTSIPEGSVEASEVRLAKLERMYEDESGGAVRWVFAWKAGYTLIDADFLDAGHWVNRHVKDFDGAEFDLDVVSPGKAVPFEPGRWLWGRTVRFCKAYRITIGEETLEVTDASLYHCFDEDDARENGEILIPLEETSGRVVHQVQDFMDENDQYQEHEADEEEALMQTFILAHRSERDARGDARGGAGERPAPGLPGARGAQLPRADRERKVGSRSERGRNRATSPGASAPGAFPSAFLRQGVSESEESCPAAAWFKAASVPVVAPATSSAVPVTPLPGPSARTLATGRLPRPVAGREAEDRGHLRPPRRSQAVRRGNHSCRVRDRLGEGGLGCT